MALVAKWSNLQVDNRGFSPGGAFSMRIPPIDSHYISVSIIRRRLPHWRPDGRPLFVTFHLHGSLPECRYPPPEHPSAGKAFVWMDRYLDTTRRGPLWLRREEVAGAVSDRIRAGAAEDRLYDLQAWVVMANHVHMLVHPLIEPSERMRRIKGRTAREANLLLNRVGEPFWQRESYDRWIRSVEEFAKVTRYIERNPVTAGLVSTAEEHRWSSAWPGWAKAEAEASVAS